MSEWHRIKFEDLLVGKKISYGVVQPGQFQEVGGVPLIRVNNIKNAKVDVSDIVKIHEDVEAKYSKTRLSGGELLITVVGSVGECAIVTEDLKGFNVARAVSVANIVDGVDKRFVAYQFRTEDIKFQMYGNTNDTVQPTLNLTELKQLIFTLPTLPEQKAIASVLSSLDDKIDLLHRQNNTLEAMVETLFRQWFIVEAKEDWEKVTLGEIVNITSSKRIFYSEYVDEGVPFYRSKEIIELHKSGQTSSELFITNERFDEIASKFGAPSKGDILLTSVGTLGVTYQVKANEKFYFKDGNLTWFKDFQRISSNIILCWLNSKDGKEQLDNISIGSTQAALTIQGLKSLELNLPPEDVMQKLDEQLEVIYQKVNANLKQLQKLEQLRDTLLPKLMSGEVRVQYQTEEVA